MPEPLPAAFLIKNNILSDVALRFAIFRFTTNKLTQSQDDDLLRARSGKELKRKSRLIPDLTYQVNAESRAIANSMSPYLCTHWLSSFGVNPNHLEDSLKRMLLDPTSEFLIQ